MSWGYWTSNLRPELYGQVRKPNPAALWPAVWLPGAVGGARTDRETGLVLMGWRYYDPETGRFLTRDPIGYSGGMNLYGYVGGNPVNWVDPLGLMKLTSLSEYPTAIAVAIAQGNFKYAAELIDDIAGWGGKFLQLSMKEVGRWVSQSWVSVPRYLGGTGRLIKPSDFKCGEYAQFVRMKLNEMGMNYVQYEFQTGKGDLFLTKRILGLSFQGEKFSKNGYHTIVVSNGTVFDSVARSGMPVKQWEALTGLSLRNETVWY
ncbi:MAG: RHS repeat-associated core domain-containing protein [Syntrophobacteraceae bacterium]